MDRPTQPPTETATQPATELRQRWPLPRAPRPIVVIGAGSIVRDAHLPVYARLGFPVAGIFDVDVAASRERAQAFAIPRVFASLDEAAAVPGVVFDLAVPPGEIAAILAHLPEGAAVLMQKPMGRDLADARRIRDICRARRLTAAVNFQLRFAPNMLALRHGLERGLLGELTDIEVRLNLHTPWDYWAFLRNVPRLEVLVHSVHYLDLIRALAGEPHGVYCRGVRHPSMPDYPDVRTSIILDYGDHLRCSLTLNHTHRFGARHAVSQLKLEGTRGAAIAKMGVNLNYPHGEPDALEMIVAAPGGRRSIVDGPAPRPAATERRPPQDQGGTSGGAVSTGAADEAGWASVALRGSWFLEAFEGPMANLQRFVAGEDAALVSSIEDAFHTMALVEACYESSARGATPIPSAE